MKKTMGDVLDPSLRETLIQWEHLGRRPYIVSPDWTAPKLPGLEPHQALLDQHLLPRLWQLLSDYPQLLQKFVYRVQQPGWMEPAASADPLDLCSEVGVPLQNGVAVTIATFQVPDRHVASFRWFGHMLDVAAEWGTVTWTIRVNKKPVRTYFNFKNQRGLYANPTRLAAPIKLKGKDVIEVLATGGATPVNAIVRVQGWLVAVTSVTQDGTAKDWNVR